LNFQWIYSIGKATESPVFYFYTPDLGIEEFKGLKFCNALALYKITPHRPPVRGAGRVLERNLAIWDLEKMGTIVGFGAFNLDLIYEVKDLKLISSCDKDCR
jgi:hypothetical protein